jgi:uncharacterized protein
VAGPSDVTRLVCLNGGQLIGKTRLQKTVYLLGEYGPGFGFDFTYHHYGPYSEDLADATEDARVLQMLTVDWSASQDGTQYAIFKAAAVARHSGEEAADQERQRLLRMMKGYSAVELEIAATADFLKKHGYRQDPWSETRRRKGAKFTPQRAQRADELLSALAQSCQQQARAAG